MASVSQVRSLVDSALGTFLGTYNLPDGSTSPALWVRGSQQVPKDWTITGTECVIDEVPEARNIPTMSKAVVLNLFLDCNSYQLRHKCNFRQFTVASFSDFSRYGHSGAYRSNRHIF